MYVYAYTRVGMSDLHVFVWVIRHSQRLSAAAVNASYVIFYRHYCDSVVRNNAYACKNSQKLINGAQVLPWELQRLLRYIETLIRNSH